MQKLLTEKVAIYEVVDHRNLLPLQKACRKKSGGTHDLLFTEKMVLKHARSRQRNLAMAWIDYREAYDMVSHSR